MTRTRRFASLRLLAVQPRPHMSLLRPRTAVCSVVVSVGSVWAAVHVVPPFQEEYQPTCCWCPGCCEPPVESDAAMPETLHPFGTGAP